MAKTVTYTQCLLKCKQTCQFGWIPTKFAVRGKILDLKIENVWSKGWEVLQTFGLQDAVYVEVHETDYKKQRKASDI